MRPRLPIRKLCGACVASQRVLVGRLFMASSSRLP